MKVAYLENADQSAVSDAVAGVLAAREATITERTRGHIRFKDLNPGQAYTHARAGYVGTYQHTGEKEVELRLSVYARAPRRAFWGTVAAGFVASLLLFVLQPYYGVWSLVTVGAWFLLAAAFLVYMATWRASWALERDLLAAFTDAIEDAGGPTLVADDERELARLEQELAAEVLALRLKRTRKAAGTPDAPAKAPARGLSLPFKRAKAGAPETESVEAKRRRVEELRAEIARKREAMRASEPRQGRR